MSDIENINSDARHIDLMSTADALRLMHHQDVRAVESVGRCLVDIENAVQDAVRTVRGGGRVFYIGAGTSGRLGVLDAAEVRPTFGVDVFQAVMAGGDDAVRNSAEGAEDDLRAGKAAAGPVTGKDMALGISASGTTPFVLAALKEAKRKGARCWLLTSSEVRPEEKPFLDGIIKALTGPEVVAGSTRLKAATAAKLVLNMLSTAVMSTLGGVYDGLMVDVVPSNEKLVKRAEDIVAKITGCSAVEARATLEASGMRPKVAALMKLRDLSRGEAEDRLKEAGGSLRQSLL